MNPLPEEMSTTRIRLMNEEIEATVEQMEWVKLQSETSSMEMKLHYAEIYNDLRQKVCVKIGRLWYYMCGCKDMNPFQPSVESLDVNSRVRSGCEGDWRSS